MRSRGTESKRVIVVCVAALLLVFGLATLSCAPNEEAEVEAENDMMEEDAAMDETIGEDMQEEGEAMEDMGEELDDPMMEEGGEEMEEGGYGGGPGGNGP